MGLFEVLASIEDTSVKDEKNGQAKAVAVARAKDDFAQFIENADSYEEKVARVRLVQDDMDRMAQEIAEEYGADVGAVVEAAFEGITSGGHKSDCDCGFCKNKGILPGQKNDAGNDEDDDPAAELDEEPADGFDTESKWEFAGESDKKRTASSLWEHEVVDVSVRSVYEFPWEHVAAETETGDHYQSERVELPTSDGTGLGGPSPEIDKGKAGDETGSSQSPIDVESVRNKLEKQDASDGGDYNDQDFLRDLDSPVHTDAHVTDSVGPPDTDRTKTWSGTEGLADPVTSAVLSKWSVIVEA